MIDLIERCVIAFEARGEEAVEVLLQAHPSHAVEARRQFEALRAAGILLAPAPEPTQIGPYIIVRRLGMGGMGVVYLAEQQQPLRREVALKVIRPGMDTREVLARFAVERQALASIDHPHVAKVFDAGVTADNRPYLVMEYVPGTSLSAWCDQQRLALPARLELFAQVCDAVQHAHHKGILHRDLKPSNVLVSERAGQPWPMVIDFGVAKSTAGLGLPHTFFTHQGALLGTPEYMSPEQANGDLDLDTRTDVYSLGVMLFELVTGTLPIASQRFRSHGLLEVARILRESDPPTPSHRLTELGRAADACADNRSTDLSSLRRQVRGDLDWILLKALEKDRNRRYGMPAELAADLRRHLAHEPVLAGPPTARYRLTKLVRRHRWKVTVAASFLLSLVLGLVSSLRFAREASASAHTAQQQAELAARETERALASERAAAELAAHERAIAKRLGMSQQTTLDALDEMIQFGMERLTAMPQSESLRRELLQQALVLHERLLAEDGNRDPRLHYTLSRTLLQVGRLQLSLDEPKGALATLQRADDELQLLAAESQQVFEVRQHRAQLELVRATLLRTLREPARARGHAEAARSAFAALATDRPTELEQHAGLLTALFELSLLTEAPGERARWLEQAEPTGTLILAGKPTDRQRADAVIALLELANLRFETGAQTAALALADLAEQGMAPALQPDRLLLTQLQMRGSLDRLAQLRFRAGQTDRARQLLQRAIDLLRQATASFPQVDSFQNDYVTSLSNFSAVLARIGSRAEVVAMQTEILARWEQFLQQTPDDQERREGALRAAMQLASTLNRWWRDTGIGDARSLDRVAARIATLLPLQSKAARNDRPTRTLLLAAGSATALRHHLRGDAAAANAAFAEVEAQGLALCEQFAGVDPLVEFLAEQTVFEAHVRLAAGDGQGARATIERAITRLHAVQQRQPAVPNRLLRDCRVLLARCCLRSGDEATLAAMLEQLATGTAAADHLAIAQIAVAALGTTVFPRADAAEFLSRGKAAAARCLALCDAGDEPELRRTRARALHLQLRLLAAADAWPAALDGLAAAITAAGTDADALLRLATFAAAAAEAARERNDAALTDRAERAGVDLLRSIVGNGFPDPDLLREHPELRGLRTAPGFDATLASPR